MRIKLHFGDLIRETEWKQYVLLPSVQKRDTMEYTNTMIQWNTPIQWYNGIHQYNIRLKRFVCLIVHCNVFIAIYRGEI